MVVTLQEYHPAASATDQSYLCNNAVQDIIFERQRDRDNAEHARQLALMEREMAAKDRELLLARLDAKLLSYERSLPPPTGSLDDTL